MDKSSSTVCILIAALCALVHFGTAFSKVKPKPDVLITKPGVCPRKRWDFGLCVESCSNDYDCRGKEKCCPNGCGRECMAPVGVLPPKPECPPHLNLALSRKGCNDCPRDHTCCVYNGYEVCIPPVRTKPGECPRTHLTVGLCGKLCSNDNDCPGKEKCCSTKCGRNCIAPYIVPPPKPECPQHLNLALSRKGCNDCPRDHTCCVYNGYEVCIPPVRTKPGECPRTHLTVGLCGKLCSNDNDCPGKEKCCSTKCGRNCIAPYIAKPGVCPRRHLTVGLCVEFCSNDSDCPGKQKCCSTRCGRKCMAPYVVKPGVCPHRRFDNIMCGEFCSNDSDCPNNEKCCFSGCGHQCMAPYTDWYLV
ncbi:WAP four-disulfide core domain protein 3-like isoform X2 [Simochromis diagramma]|uniref:WAP four-disulfide core domain protein 3-like isoform X2 n=1 Tax=Simochromis diagramma TaxID=43689 RepID=UPI001A7E6FD2|nr:WAP four-disulfide core domain protein 3-like isoform X2 [Simochromis diagramma]